MNELSGLVPLSSLKRGQKGIIRKIGKDGLHSLRLLELGFVQSAQVWLEHEAPLFRDPIMVAINGTHIAVRRADVGSIYVELIAGE